MALARADKFASLSSSDVFGTLPLETIYHVLFYLSADDLFNLAVCSVSGLNAATNFVSFKHANVKKLLTEMRAFEAVILSGTDSFLIEYFEDQIKSVSGLQAVTMFSANTINFSGMRNYKHVINAMDCIKLIHKFIHEDDVNMDTVKYFYFKLQTVAKKFQINSAILTNPGLMQKYTSYIATSNNALAINVMLDILDHDKSATRKDLAELFNVLVASAENYSIFSSGTALSTALSVFTKVDRAKDSKCTDNANKKIRLN